MNLKRTSPVALMLSLLISVCPLQAGDNPLQGESSSTSKRPASTPLDEPEAKRQVFGRATYDTTAKYVLEDNEIRLDFVKTFTGIKDITDTESLDKSLNPIHRLTNIRELLAKPETKAFMKKVKDKPNEYFVSGAKGMGVTPGTDFIRELSQWYDDLVDTFPKDRASQFDILCKLSNGDYTLVEIQVAKEDFWDERALAYIASIYGGQLQAGDKWKDLKKVIGINILGGGPKNIQYWTKKGGKDQKPEKFKRHYLFQDQYNSDHVIPMIQLFQYSLGDISWDDEDVKNNKNLKDWLQYFKSSYQMTEIPADISEPLKKAYERTQIDKMPKDIRDLYDKEDRLFTNFTEHEEKVKEIGREEGKELGLKEGMEKGALVIAKNLLKTGMSVEDIVKNTGLTPQQVEGLKGDD